MGTFSLVEISFPFTFLSEKKIEKWEKIETSQFSLDNWSSYINELIF